MNIEEQIFKILPDQMQIPPTEIRNPNSMNLSNNNINEILNLILDDTYIALKCLSLYLNDIEKLIENVINCLKNGGRLFYCGAGSSGRLALLDSIECPATFGCRQIQTIIAGDMAFVEEQGFAEDCILDGYQKVEKLNIKNNDFILGITASGHTRFVWSCLYCAFKQNSNIGLLTFNNSIKPKFKIENLIAINSGAEILTGSTRLKAGTCTKLILNMISTTALVKLGYCVSNLMICVKPTNLKLKQRLVNILMQLLDTKNKDINEDKAIELLEKNNYDIKKVLSFLNLNTIHFK